MDYTDIHGKIEELQSGIDELSALVDKSYRDIFHDGNEIILGGMLHTLTNLLPHARDFSHELGCIH